MHKTKKRYANDKTVAVLMKMSSFVHKETLLYRNRLQLRRKNQGVEKSMPKHGGELHAVEGKNGVFDAWHDSESHAVSHPKMAESNSSQETVS